MNFYENYQNHYNREYSLFPLNDRNYELFAFVAYLSAIRSIIIRFLYDSLNGHFPSYIHSQRDSRYVRLGYG